jgi:DJ-1/PfpI family
MGFLNTPELVARLADTPKLGDEDLATYDALVVAGGLSPMFTYRDDEGLRRAIVAFYEAEKLVAVYCHGVSALIDAKLSDGSYLISGKKPHSRPTSSGGHASLLRTPSPECTHRHTCPSLAGGGCATPSRGRVYTPPPTRSLRILRRSSRMTTNRSHSRRTSNRSSDSAYATTRPQSERNASTTAACAAARSPTPA